MAEVFISKFNSLKLLRGVPSRYKNQVDISQLLPVELTLFGQSEINKILAHEVFLINPQLFIDKYYVRMKDSLSFVFERPPAFHNNITCQFLHSSFENIYIPKKIKDGNTNENNLLKRFRNWCLDNQSLYQNNRLAFIAQCCIAFSNNDLNESDFRGIERKNTNKDSVRFDNINLEDLTNEVINSYDIYKSEIGSSEKKSEIHENFKDKLWLATKDAKDIKINNTKYSNEEVLAVLKQLYPLHQNLYYLIMEWQQIKLNKN